jgi:hypothetical protein
MIRISGDVLVNKYVSLRDGGLNTAAFVAGVVNGVLDAAEFVRAHLQSLSPTQLDCRSSPHLLVCFPSQPSKVSAHYVKPKTVILIKFEPEVIAREKRLKA